MTPWDVSDAHDVWKAIRDGIKKGNAARAAAAAAAEKEEERKRMKKKIPYFQPGAPPPPPADERPIKLHTQRKVSYQQMPSAAAAAMSYQQMPSAAAAATESVKLAPSFHFTPSSLRADGEASSTHTATSTQMATSAAAATESVKLAPSLHNTPTSMTYTTSSRHNP
jgi:hypothetical protein